MEDCKWIKGYEGRYKATSCGNILSYCGTIVKKLKLCNTGRGYLQVSLYKNGKYKNYYIHRLVLMTYKPIKCKKQVNHIDGNTFNNNINNLEWVTPKENILHAKYTLKRKVGFQKNHTHGNISKNKGENNVNSKLSEKEVKEIRKLCSIGVPQHIIAENYNVSRTVISFIKTRRTWKHC